MYIDKTIDDNIVSEQNEIGCMMDERDDAESQIDVREEEQESNESIKVKVKLTQTKESVALEKDKTLKNRKNSGGKIKHRCCFVGCQHKNTTAIMKCLHPRVDPCNEPKEDGSMRKKSYYRRKLLHEMTLGK